MAAKEFLAKIILGSDVHKDLAIAEKEMNEVKDKYNNTCQTINVLEEKYRVLSVSLDTSKQEFSSLQGEKDSIDTLLKQLLNADDLGYAKAILEGRFDDKNALLRNLIEKLHSSQEEHDQTLNQLRKLQEGKSSLENDVDNLTREIELSKEKSKQREEQKAKREVILSQRRGIRDNLLTLKNEWQDTLDIFKARKVDADSLKSLEGLKRELEDYERRVNNAIEIPVK